MESEQKYVVFKTDEWLDVVTHTAEAQLPEPLEPTSFTVIRHQDIFAESALLSYANSIQTALEILQVTEGKTDPGLEDLRDLFWERASMAKAAQKRIPD